MRSLVVAAALIHVAIVVTPFSAIAEDAAGWRIYRNPATGQMTAPPSGTVPSAAERSNATAAAAALREETTADGTATFVDLRGQFRATIRAERDAGGVRVHCAPPDAAPAPKP